ncbi:MAG: peptidoglycan-binding domain-containing protein [Patescibacteria group bacterium]
MTIKYLSFFYLFNFNRFKHILMKKYLIALLLLFSPLYAFAQGFDYDLFYGLRANEEVKELQELLSDKGFYSGPITGNFFSLTVTGVKKLQAAYGITPTSGYFGPKTRTKANEILAASGITKTDIATENGIVPTPVIIPSKTTTDVVSSLADQIKLLQQQLAVLQQSQSTLQQQNQQLTQQTQVIQQQSQIPQQVTQQDNQSTPLPVSTNIQPQVISNINSTQTQIEIKSVKVVPSLRSASFEWETNIPTNAKVFVSGSGISTIVSQSNSGMSTRHITTASPLQANTSYTFEIEAVSGALVGKNTGSFKTTSLASLKIISPTNGKGLGRKYVANKEIVDESNYIELGFIVRNDVGESMRDAKGVIEATDEDQNKTLIGTGNVTKIYNGEIPESVYYYPFHYEFKNAGQHTITFTANGMTESVTLTVN